MKIPDVLHTIEAAELVLKSPLRPIALKAISAISERIIEKALLSLTAHADPEEIDNFLCLLPDHIAERMLKGKWGEMFGKKPVVHEAVIAEIMRRRAFVRDRLTTLGWSDRKGIGGYSEHLLRTTRFRPIQRIQFPNKYDMCFEKDEHCLAVHTFDQEEYAVTRKPMPRGMKKQPVMTTYTPSFSITRFERLPRSDLHLTRKETFTCPLEYFELLHGMITQGFKNAPEWVEKLEEENYRLDHFPTTIDGLSGDFLAFAPPEEPREDKERDNDITEYVGCINTEGHTIVGIAMVSDIVGPPPTITNFCYLPADSKKHEDFADILQGDVIDMLDHDFTEVTAHLYDLLGRPLPEPIHGTGLVQEALFLVETVRKFRPKLADNLIKRLREPAENNLDRLMQTLEWHVERPDNATPEYINALIAEAETTIGLLDKMSDAEKPKVLSVYRRELYNIKMIIKDSAAAGKTAAAFAPPSPKKL